MRPPSLSYRFGVVAILTLLPWMVSGQNARYTYDDLNRLVSVDYGGGHVIRYIYDEAGNRTRLEVTFNANRPPLVTTSGAGGVGTTTATLAGVVNPLGAAATGWFEWGTSPTFGSRTADQAVPAGTQSSPFGAPLAGLLPNTQYYFRAAASNGAGVAYGAAASFKTQRLQNTLPVAVNDVLPASVETQVSFDPRTNDSDGDGDALTISAVGNAQFGYTAFTATSVTYTPYEGFSGADRFSYTISDGNGGTAQAFIDVGVKVRAIPQGPTFIVNSHRAGYQQMPRVATARDGRSLIAWAGEGDQNARSIYGQALDSAGTPLRASDIWLAEGYTAPVDEVAVGRDRVGNFFLSMSGLGTGEIILINRRIDTALVAGPLVGPSTPETIDSRPAIDVAPDAESSVFITWTKANFSDPEQIEKVAVHRVRNDLAGTFASGEIAENGIALVHPQVAAGPSTALVVWTRSVAWFESDVYAQVIRYDGSVVRGPFRVNTHTSGVQGGDLARSQDVAADPHGNFVVVWTSYAQDGDYGGIYAQRYDPNGLPIGGEFRLNSVTQGDQRNPAIDADANGNFVVTWQGEHRPTPWTTEYPIIGRVFYANGAAASDEFTVATAGYEPFSKHVDVALENDIATVVWQLGQTGCSFSECITDIAARRFTLPGLNPKADLRITQTHDRNWVAGRQESTAIHLSNVGYLEAAGPFTVNATLPLGFIQYADLTNSIAGTNWNCSLQEMGNALNASCQYQDPSGASFRLAPGQSLPDIVWSLQPLVPAVPGFTATATLASSDANAANNEAADVIVVEAISDLGVTLQTPPPAAVGQQVQLTTTVGNAGPSIAHAVQLTHIFSTPVVVDEVRYTGAARTLCGPNDADPLPPSPPCDCRKDDVSVSCRFGAVGNTPRAATVKVRPLVAGTVTASATAFPSVSWIAPVAESFDPQTGNNLSVSPLTVSGSGDLSLALTGLPETIAPDDVLTYTATLSNRGPNPVSAATLTAPLPAGVTFVSASSGCAAAGGQVQCAWNMLGTNETVAATFTVRVNGVGHGPLDATAAAASAAADPIGGNNQASVRNIVNRVPVASDAAYTLAEDSSFVGALAAVDGDGAALVFSVATPPAGGTVVITNAATGAFRYTPHPNFNGPDTFTFRASDDLSPSNVATVALAVTSVNDLPVASDSSISVSEEDGTAGRMTATDADGDALTYEIVNRPVRGTVTFNATNGDFTYLPGIDGDGTDEFTFRTYDGKAHSNIARIDITLASRVDTWMPLGPAGGTVLSLARVHGTPNTVFAGTNAGVFRSKDGAATWTVVLAGGQTRAFAIDPVTPTTIYAGIGSLIYKSVDGGDTWGSASSGLPLASVFGLAVDPLDPQRVYAAFNNGLYATSNGGETWTLRGATLSGKSLKAIVVDSLNPAVMYAATTEQGGIYKTINSGDTWTLSNSGLGSIFVETLVLDSARATLYAGTSAGVFKSVNAGASWTSASTGLTGIIYAIEIAGTVVYASNTAGRVYRTTNSGVSWIGDSGGLPATFVFTLSADPQGGQVLAGVSGSGVFASVDSGVSWTPSKTGLNANALFTLVTLSGAPVTLHAAGQSSQMFRSSNDGATWAASAGAPQTMSPQVEVADVVNPQLLFAGFSSGLYRSVDGGVTWQSSATGLTNTNVLSMASIAANTALAGTSTGVFRTTNGGASWGNRTLGANGSTNALAVDPSNRNIVYAGTTRGVHRSDDGGVTWVARNAGISSTSINRLALDPVTTTTIYATAPGQLLKSIDGGLSWFTLPATGLDLFLNVTALGVDTTASRVYASTLGGGVFQSMNGGTSWTSVGSALTHPAVHALALRNDGTVTLYAATSGGVYRLQRGAALTVSQSGTGSGKVTSQPAGIDCGGFCSAEYLNGRSITLQATADANSRFTAWGGDSDCADGVVTMTDARSCIAIFDLVANPPPGVTVTRPTVAGEKLFTGTPYLIEWAASDNDLASFDVSVSTNGGTSYAPIPGCSALPAAARNCLWTSPGPTTSKGRIRVTARDAGGNASSDSSDANFAIASGAGSIAVTQPNSALGWGVGGVQQIKWNHNFGANSWVRLEVSRDGGATWSIIVDGLKNSAGSNGTYLWAVTGPPTAAARIKVTWLNGAVSDQSNVNFSIVSPVLTLTQPNTSLNWATGTVRQIKWSHNLGVDTFSKVEVTRNNGTSWEVVAPSVRNSAVTSGTFDWLVTGPPASQARVRVTALTASPLSDQSDVAFTISDPVISVTSPASASTSWGYNAVRRVTWDTNLSAELVDVLLSTDGGVTFPHVLAANIAASAKSATITTPALAVPTTNARLRVRVAASPAVQGTSPAGFRVEPPSVVVSSPNGPANAWTIGTSKTVVWANNLGNSENVRIELSLDGGATYTVVVLASTPSDGSQKVNVSPAWATPQGRIRVVWLKDGTVADVSDASFAIQ